MKKREQELDILERKDELRREWEEYRILFKRYRYAFPRTCSPAFQNLEVREAPGNMQAAPRGREARR